MDRSTLGPRSCRSVNGPGRSGASSTSHTEAKALNHDYWGQDHLLLALLHPDCPGAARPVLESFGITARQFRESFAASMDDPYEPHHRGITFPPTTQLLLERANLEALALADGEASSEHVLLALTGRWDSGFAAGWLRRHGIDAAALRRHVVDFTETGELPEPAPPAAGPPWPGGPDPAAGLELVPTPDGKDPRQRRPWGSVMFTDERGRTFRYGLALRQYFIDRDGNPVLTTDGRPVHLLVDEHGNHILDAGAEESARWRSRPAAASRRPAHGGNSCRYRIPPQCTPFRAVA